MSVTAGPDSYALAAEAVAAALADAGLDRGATWTACSSAQARASAKTG